MDQIMQNFHAWLIAHGLSVQLVTTIKVLSTIAGIALLSFIADFITKQIIVRSIKIIVSRSKNVWDDIFLERKVFHRLAHIAPAIVVYYAAKWALADYAIALLIITKLINIFYIIIGASIFIAFFRAVEDIYQQLDSSNTRPIKGYVQLLNIFVICVAIILTISVITGNSPNKLLAGLGAMAAVLMLVFKDTILGFVASVQLSANNMVKIGDWIEMPSRKADGTVLEITLNTVKVQNWDKTISTIPTYTLVSESFTNWRGMEESGGRRIKRSINIDMTSVKFCNAEMLETFTKIKHLNHYITTKTKELQEHNAKNNIDETVLVNGLRLTNLGVFRKYVEMYLRDNPKINKNMSFLVRQLQPTENGIPIEIYVFSLEKAWADYESVQADIFDHLLAILPEFQLRIFQKPSSYSFER